MSVIERYDWKPEPNNPVQVSFADLLEVFPTGVTKHQFASLYAAFLGGMIFSPTLLALGIPSDKLLEMINEEGKMVSGLMTECNSRFN